MEHAKKMVMVPHDFFIRLNNKKEEQLGVTNGLDSELSSLLNNDNGGDSEKWTKYQQVLQRYLRFKEQERQPLKLTVEEDKGGASTQYPLENEILDSIPRTFKKRAELLLQRLNSSKDITWDQRGEVTIKGIKLGGSNITDLVSDIVRPRKTSNPNAWQEFCSLLKDINIPHEFIGNPSRMEYMTSGSLLSPTINKSSTPYRTPGRRKTLKTMSFNPRRTPANSKVVSTPNTSWEKYRL